MVLKTGRRHAKEMGVHENDIMLLHVLVYVKRIKVHYLNDEYNTEIAPLPAF